MEALFPSEVERFAMPAESGTGILLDVLGMLSLPGLSWHDDGGLVGIRALACAGSFPLLGEPGAGKTAALVFQRAMT